MNFPGSNGKFLENRSQVRKFQILEVIFLDLIPEDIIPFGRLDLIPFDVIPVSPLLHFTFIVTT